MGPEGVAYKLYRLNWPLWQKNIFYAGISVLAVTVGTYMHNLSHNRYNSFRGRTSLFGPEQQNAGKFINQK